MDSFLLLEDGGYVVQEDNSGGKILLEVGTLASPRVCQQLPLPALVAEPVLVGARAWAVTSPPGAPMRPHVVAAVAPPPPPPVVAPRVRQCVATAFPTGRGTRG